jgi:hypothetical protein
MNPVIVKIKFSAGIENADPCSSIDLAMSAAEQHVVALIPAVKLPRSFEQLEKFTYDIVVIDICDYADHPKRSSVQYSDGLLLPPKPFPKNDQAKQDLVIVLLPRGMLLEEPMHSGRAKVLIDLRSAVKEGLGHAAVECTAKPIVHHIDSKTAFRPS